MAILSNAHTHTNYCDGRDSAEDMVKAAIEKGFRCLGFSSHCYTSFDESYAMSPGGTTRYIREIRGLKEKYRGKIDIMLGTEWDYYTEIDREEYDYTIGSVHYIKSPLTDQYYPVDAVPEELERCLEEGFHGNVMAMLSAYYDSVAEMAASFRPTILGHFDLIRKLNRDSRFFDEESPAYLHLAVTALEKVVRTGTVVEVNTGGIYRGYRSTPYPAEPLLKKLRELGGKVIVSSDAHDTAGIDYMFPQMEKLLKKLGFKEIQVLTAQGLKGQKL